MELLEQPNSKLLTNLGITGIAKLIRRGCSYNIGHKVHHWKWNFLVAFLHLSVWTAPDPALSNWLEHGQAMVSYLWTWDSEELVNFSFKLSLVLKFDTSAYFCDVGDGPQGSLHLASVWRKKKAQISGVHRLCAELFSASCLMSDKQFMAH